MRKLLDGLSPTARDSPDNRKGVRNNSPETKKQQKLTKKDWKRQMGRAKISAI